MEWAVFPEAWHRPTYKVTANGSYNLYEKIIFQADIIAQGGMKALDPVTDSVVKLKAAFDLSFKTEYLFSNSFSAFLQFNNMTSNKYPVFSKLSGKRLPGYRRYYLEFLGVVAELLGV